MAFTKTALNSVVGSSVADLIFVNVGDHALTGTIAALAGVDELRFNSTIVGDLLFIGGNITGVEIVRISGGISAIPTPTSTALDIDASSAVNGLSIFGNLGANFIIGSEFADVIAISGGVDDLYGGAGNDLFTIGTAGLYNLEVVIDGGAGFDEIGIGAAGTVTFGAATYVERVSLTGTAAINVNASAVFNDVGLIIVGNTAVNIVTGTDFGDTITGGAGADQLLGGGGNDVFLVDAAADLPTTEKIEGQEGSDEIRFVSTTAGQTLSLNPNVTVEIARISNAAGDSSGTTALNVTATGVLNALTLIGNDGANTFRGTSLNDTMLGGGGNDIFIISSAFDHKAAELIQGGAGFDRIAYDPIATSVAHILQLAPGTDVEEINIVTSAGNIDASALSAGVILTGSPGFNSLVGGSGNDTLEGMTGEDHLRGGLGDDVFLYRNLADVGTLGSTGGLLTVDDVNGGAGTDTLLFNSNGAFGGTIKLNDLNTVGIERVEFAAGNAAMLVLWAFDVTAGGLTFIGNDASSNVIATFQDDVLMGGGGSDALSGNTGDDTVRGGAGNDFINEVGGGGADDLDGEEGSDFYDLLDFFLNPLDPLFVLNDSGTSGTDSVRFIFRTNVSAALPENISGIETLFVSVETISNTPHTVDFDASSSDVGLAIVGSTQANSRLTLTGTEFGDDLSVAVTSSFRSVHLIGGAGNDTLSGNQDSRFDGGAGHDVLRLGAGGLTVISPLWTGIEAVELTGVSGGQLRAGLSANALEITGNGAANAIIATAYGDVVNGGGGNDVLSGGPGGDTLIGGSGVDQLLGGAGDDVFRDFDAGERVQGGAGEDTLELTGSGQTLDLTVTSNTALSSVEVIDITGTGDNTLRLNADDVRFDLGRNGTLRVDRDAGDTVDLVGTWSQTGSSGGYTTYQGSKYGQTVYVEVEDTVAGGAQHYFAIDGPDDFTGGAGNDTITFVDGTFDYSDDTIDGGDGMDLLEVDGTLVNMAEGTFSGIENVELKNGADFEGNADNFFTTAISGANQARLGNNGEQGYLGNSSIDQVWFGAAGQSVSTGLGADIVRVETDEISGSIIDLGSDGGSLILEGSGTADLTTATSVSGGLNVSYASGISIVKLGNAGQTAIVSTDVTFYSGNNSGGDDTFVYGNLDWTGRSTTINGFLSGAGNDRFVLDDIWFDGAYLGATTNAAIDAFLPDNGLRNAVFNTDNYSLIVDYDRDGVWGAGDLWIVALTSGVLTQGVDLIIS